MRKSKNELLPKFLLKSQVVKSLLYGFQYDMTLVVFINRRKIDSVDQKFAFHAENYKMMATCAFFSEYYNCRNKLLSNIQLH